MPDKMIRVKDCYDCSYRSDNPKECLHPESIKRGVHIRPLNRKVPNDCPLEDVPKEIIPDAFEDIGKRRNINRQKLHQCLYVPFNDRGHRVLK